MNDYMNIVFLDIDGVLTSDEGGTSYHCEVPEDYHPEARCKANFMCIVEEVPDLKVVLHTSWTNHVNDEVPSMERRGKVYMSPLNEVCEWLNQYGLLLGVVSTTKHDEQGNRITKKQKILSWLLEHRVQIDPLAKVLVLDDDVAFNDLPSLAYTDVSFIGKIKFQQVDFHTGLTEEDAMKAIAFFKGGD